MDYLAACCVFKNEDRYLREWIEYHRMVGVQRFYMVSNDDDPGSSRALLQPYIDSGEVIFEWRPGGPFVNLQTTIYLDVLIAATDQVRWLAFLDMDEFLLPVEGDSVAAVLAEYEQYAALAVNWACFGTSGLSDPPALQTAGFHMRLGDDHEENRIYKSIVDPARTLGIRSPHQCILDNEPLMDEFGGHITHPWLNQNNLFFGKRLRINHYRVRSEREFSEKLARWKNGGHPELADPEKLQVYLQRYGQCSVRDDTIQRFVPELERRLAGQ
jgi:hypothetical protein